MTTIPYKPLSRDVVFEIIEQTNSGIYLADSAATFASSDQNAIEIVAVGPDTRWIKPGDRVFMRECMPTIVVLNGKKYAQVSEADCMGIVDKDVDTSIPKSMMQSPSIN